MSELNGQTVIPAVDYAPPQPPFDQKAHDLMQASYDQLLQGFAGEIDRVIGNLQQVKQAIIAETARSKSQNTRMHLLGMITKKEADRGQELAQHIADELDKLAEETRQ